MAGPKAAGPFGPVSNPVVGSPTAGGGGPIAHVMGALGGAGMGGIGIGAAMGGMGGGALASSPRPAQRAAGNVPPVDTWDSFGSSLPGVQSLFSQPSATSAISERSAGSGDSSNEMCDAVGIGAGVVGGSAFPGTGSAGGAPPAGLGSSMAESDALFCLDEVHAMAPSGPRSPGFSLLSGFTSSAGN